MTFGELVCTVARLRFATDAQVGARASPIAIDAEDVADIVTAARAVLGGAAHVAVACPGVTPVEEDRLCVAAGERAAERATYWRNTIDTEAGERILYLSARRLGRAGGLQDTLFDLSERRLREGFLEWCGSPAAGCPVELACALRDSGVAERADSRSLARFATAVFGREDALQLAGSNLPLLLLARDASFADAPGARLTSNVRWVRAASGGESRAVSKLSDAAREIRAALDEALMSTADPSAALAEIDLGALSAAELDSDVPKPKTRRKAKVPKTVAPRQPQPAESPSHLELDGAEPRESEAEGDEHDGPDAKDPVKPTAAGSTSAERSASAPATQARPAVAPPPTSRPSTSAVTPPAAEAPAPRERAPSPAAPAEPAAHTEESSSGAAVSDPSGSRAAPPTRRSKPTATTTVRPGPWTEEMHFAELGRPAPLPDGVRALLLRSLTDGPRALRWVIRGDDPARILAKLPRGLGEPVPAQALPEDLRENVEAWEGARARLLDALGGAELLLARLSASPLTWLGASAIAPLVSELCRAGAELMAAAARTGATDAKRALELDTVIVSTPAGPACVVLSPVHPLMLVQHLARLPAAAASARADGAHRSVLARGLDGPLRAPDAWPCDDRVLIPFSPAPGIIGFGDAYRSLAATDVESISAALTARFLEVTPHAALGLRVAVDADDPDPVVAGVSSALAEGGRFWIHVSRPVRTSEAPDVLLGGGQITLLPPPTPDERPHVVIRVRHGAPTASAGDDDLQPYADAVRASLRRDQAGLVRLGAGDVQLAGVRGPVAAEDSGWEAIIAPSLVGPPEHGPSVLIREAQGSAEVAVLTRDVRAAGRDLEPVLQQMGLADVRPKTVRALVGALASGSAGVLSLEGPNERQLAAQLLEHVMLERLGESAAVTVLRGRDARLWLGAGVAAEEWGSFAVGAVRRAASVQVAVGYCAIVGALDADALRPRFEHFLRLLRQSGSHAASPLAEVLKRSSRPMEDLPDGQALQPSFVVVVPGEHGWARGGRVGDAAVEGTEIGTMLLEAVALMAGRRRAVR